jgi:hypothetical protein
VLLASLLAASPLFAAVPADYKGVPFGDEFHQAQPAAIPGILQCALYDRGGPGVAYHDTTPANEGSDGLNREVGHQRAHANAYVWHFRSNEGVDLSYVKDWADLNHPNLVAPPINLHYIGWTSDGEWTNYTVNVAKAGTYRIRALYSHQANKVRFSLNRQPASECQLPVATGGWHSWNYAEIGVITFPEPGVQLLTFHYNLGNNFAFFSFEPVATPAPSTAP